MSESTAFAVKFAVEEIFTNMVKYNPNGEGDIAIDINANDERLSVQLTDRQIHPFDPTATPAVDLFKPIEERNPGGLGIHLTKEMVDGFTFDHAGNESKVTLTFRLGQ